MKFRKEKNEEQTTVVDKNQDLIINTYKQSSEGDNSASKKNDTVHSDEIWEILFKAARGHRCLVQEERAQIETILLNNPSIINSVYKTKVVSNEPSFNNQSIKTSEDYYVSFLAFTAVTLGDVETLKVLINAGSRNLDCFYQANIPYSYPRIRSGADAYDKQFGVSVLLKRSGLNKDAKLLLIRAGYPISLYDFMLLTDEQVADDSLREAALICMKKYYQESIDNASAKRVVEINAQLEFVKETVNTRISDIVNKSNNVVKGKKLISEIGNVD